MEWKTWPMRTASTVIVARAPIEPIKETTRFAFIAKSAATKKVLSPISLEVVRKILCQQCVVPQKRKIFVNNKF